MFELLESFENPDIFGKWETRLEEERFKIYSKIKGSELTSNFYMIKAIKVFKASCSPERVMKALFNAKERILWDTDMNYCEILKVVDRKYVIWYQINNQAVKLTNK
jgi:hypothetical protein